MNAIKEIQGFKAELIQIRGSGQTRSVGDVFGTGGRTITHMVLATDGNGPMGMYDQVHMFVDDKLNSTYPAHNLYGWTYNE